MATKIGPKTVTQRDRSKALVFCIDAAHSDSYGGEPTTNLAPPDLADWNPSGTSVRTAAGYTFQGQPVYKCRTQVGSVWIGIDKTISGLQTAASGSTVCMSIWVKNPNPSQYSFYAYIGHDFSSTRTLVANSGWQKIEWTVAVGSMGNDYVEYRPYTNSADIYIHMTMPQVEVKAVSTPFTTSSRSATTAITNISGVGAQGTDWIQGSAADTYGQQLYKPTTRNVLATIDPNQGHIGGAYWDFDGTDEYIVTANENFTNSSQAVSVSQWVNMSSSLDSNDRKLFHWGGGGNAVMQMRKGDNNGRIKYQIHSGGSWRTVNIDSYFEAADTWYHFAVVQTSSTVMPRIYRNGEEMSHGTSTWYVLDYSLVNSISIGSRQGNEPWKGPIANFMMWSSALTSKEIKDIYIAQKGRFGK